MSEKRYFKLFAKRHQTRKGNQYIRLFMLLDKMHEYDETELKKRSGRTGLNLYLSQNKNYLFQLILRSLRDYHSCNTIDLRLKEMLESSEILYEKGLYRESLRLLGKTKRLAYRYERFTAILEIIRWEDKILRRAFISSFSLRVAGRMEREEKKILSLIGNLNYFKWLNSRVGILHVSEQFSRRPAELGKYHRLFRRTLPVRENQARSLQARIWFHQIHATYAQSRGDYAGNFLHTRRIIELIEKDREVLPEYIEAYIAGLNNFSDACFKAGQTEECLEVIRKLRQMEDSPPCYLSLSIRVKIFESYATLLLNVFCKTGDIKKGILFAVETQQKLPAFKGKISKVMELDIYYYTACLYFQGNRCDESLKWLNRMLNDPLADAFVDISCNARVLLLVLHFELQNTDLLEYIVKTTYRYLQKKDRLYRFEKAILHFIRKKLPHITSPARLVAAFRELKTELENITADPYERKALEYFDFISWLESKISGVPFAEIVRKKTMQNA